MTDKHKDSSQCSEVAAEASSPSESGSAQDMQAGRLHHKAGGLQHKAGRRKWLVTLICLLAGVGVLAGISALPKPPDAPQPPPALPQVVQVMAVTPVAELNDVFTLPAIVEPNRIVKVPAEVDGRIEKIELKEGQKVQAGATIVQLNTDLLAAQFERQQADANFAAKEYERVSQLQGKGIASQQDMDQAISRRATSQADLKLCKTRLERATIVAPISGSLNHIPVEIGEYVAPGACVAQIVDIDVVKVVVLVPERDIRYLKLGQKETVLLKTADGGENTFEGEITYISDLADETTHTTRVEVSVKNPDGLLRNGMMVHVRLTRRVLKDAVMIPLAAVIPAENDKQVYCVEGSKACLRKVTLGFYQGANVQVLSGLKGQEQLIVSGHRSVSDGQSVRVESEPRAEKPAGAE